ncbi:MAG: Rieske 2Fe-2S domain-containing protein [Myxococcales bacterium]|nr:Rieske 2Fe-2S domain-containing protein [Myxococcales bacterium]
MTSGAPDDDDDDLFGPEEDAEAAAAAPSAPVVVEVPVGDLASFEARLFPFHRDGWEHTGIAVNVEGRFHVYVNRCPHVPYPLDFGDGDVMDTDRSAFFCQNHGARFDLSTGVCFAGPPRGRALERLPFAQVGETLYVTIAPEPPGWPRS